MIKWYPYLICYFKFGLRANQRLYPIEAPLSFTPHCRHINKPGGVGGLNSADTSRSLINRGYFLCSVDQERKSIELLSDTLITITYDTTVFWSSPALFKSTCRLKVHDYPFDLQVTCAQATVQTQFCSRIRRAKHYHLELILYCLLSNLVLLLLRMSR